LVGDTHKKAAADSKQSKNHAQHKTINTPPLKFIKLFLLKTNLQSGRGIFQGGLILIN